MEMVRRADYEHRCMAYAWFAEVFWNVPSEELLAKYDPRFFHDSGVPDESALRLAEYLNGLTNDQLDEIAVDYTSLFAGCREGSPYPYESVFVGENGRFLMQDARDQVLEAYRKSGYRPVDSFAHEPEDHLSHELRYLSHLYSQVMVAEERKGSVVLDDIGSFKKNHLDRWIPLFCREVRQQAETDFYRLTANCLQSVCRGDLT